MAGLRDVELSKLCESCASKKGKANIMLSSSSSSVFGCVDPKCVNFSDPTNGGGRSQEYSPANELSGSQSFVLAHLQLNETKETKKLKQLLAIPPGKMNEDQRCSTKEELGKFQKEVNKLIEKLSETRSQLQKQ